MKPAWVLWIAVAALVAPMAAVQARDVCVSPDGTAGGSGAKGSPYDLVSVLEGKANVKPGDTVWMAGGVYDQTPTINVSLAGTSEAPILVRAMPNSPATISGSLEVKGHDVTYQGFEVRGLRGTPNASKNATSVNTHGPRTKYINLIVHRGAMGFGFWTPAVNAEMYGNLIFDFGFGADDRGHGHACYTQNETGTKRVVDNIMYAGYGWGQHNYTQGGQIIGYHIVGNIYFSAGMASPPKDAPKDNFLVAGYPPADRTLVAENIMYHPRRGGWRPNARMGTYRSGNKAGVFKDNYVMGLNGVALDRWEKMTATGNEIWAPGSVLTTQLAKGTSPGDWTVDKNIYHVGPEEAKFNAKTFAAYQRDTGFDAHSKLVPTVNGRPAKNRVFVRPNAHEAGRAHVAVFNWEGKDSVEIDLSAAKIKRGAKYQVKNVLDLFGKPVAEGVYDGKPVKVKMMKSAIAPDFDAFLVIGEKSFGCFVGRPDDPKMDWTTRDWSNLDFKSE